MLTVLHAFTAQPTQMVELAAKPDKRVWQLQVELDASRRGGPTT